MKREPTASVATCSRASDLSGDEDDYDEQTLQLKLEAIEAKLRLRKLQKQRHATTQESVHVPSSPKRKSANQSNPALATAVRDQALNSTRSAPRVPAARSHTTAPDRPPVQPARSRPADRSPLRPSSFNERLHSVRRTDDEASAKRQSTTRAQSTSFAIKHRRPGSPPPIADDANESVQSDRDAHSGIDLSRRFIDAHTLDEAFEDKELYPLPRLLKEVTSPTYDPPDTDGDFVVFGIIASKSNPRNHAESHSTSSSTDNGQAKFMVLHLTDLKWEIDLFLFGSGFDSFWKLTVGSVVAILNPGIMPPKRHMRDSGQFSLKLSSSEDAVLEIGTSAHLGFCGSVKKNGRECGAWFDSRQADHCDFHINLAVERSRAGRMETNTMHTFGLFGRQGGNGGGKSTSYKGRPHPAGNIQRTGKRAPSPKGRGFYRDSEAHSSAFMVPPELQKGASAARLLDAEDFTHYTGSTAEERHRKRLAGQERDRNLARQLKGQSSKCISKPNATGNEHDATGFGPIPSDANPALPDAKSLGLVGRSGMRLAPSQRTAAQAVGWSSAFKRGLPDASQSGPSPKKARFNIAGKGLRVPGRSSLEGGMAKAMSAADEDDLDIV